MADTDNPGEKIFGLRDLVFICLYIAGAAVSLFFFWRDLNAALTRLDEKPAGVVTRKYRAAQRRYAERILWERLKTESPIYNGDTIRTADASGVVVSLSADGGIIELGENTLVQIQVGKTGTLIDLAEGSVSASAGNAGLRIESGGVTINAAPGALVAAAIPAAAEAGGPEIRVLEGSAGIRQGSEDRIVAPGEVYSAAPPEARVAVVSPGPQAIFLNNAEGPLGIAFRWNRASLAAEDTVRLDVAEDRAFTLLTESRESSGGEETLYLPNGVYYWRAHPSSEAAAETARRGADGKLSVIYAPPPLLYHPAPGGRFSFRTPRPGIRFQWQALEGASAYLIEVFSSPAPEAPLFSASVQPAGGDTVSIVQSGLSAGEYSWRVTPVYPQGYAGTAQTSAASSFTIEQAAFLPAPQAKEQAETVYLEDPRQDTYLTWNQEEEAAYYTFLLSRQEDLGSPLIRKQKLDNYHVLNAREEGLEPGRYYWGVSQTGIEGNDSAFSRARIIVVTAGAPPERAALTENTPPTEARPPVPEQAASVTPAPEQAASTAPAPEQAAPERAASETSAPKAPEQAPPETPVAAAPGRTAGTEARPPAPVAKARPPAPAAEQPAPKAPETPPARPEQAARTEARPPAPVPEQPPPKAPETPPARPEQAARTEARPSTPAAEETPPAPAPRPVIVRPLPAPRNLRPEAGYVLNEEIILRDKRMVFSWEQVPGAAGYTFVLYQGEGGTNREILRQTALAVPSFTLTDLKVLDAGEFVWQVEAEGGEHGSEAALSRFRVSLSEIEAPESRESGVMFGRD